MFSDFNTQLGAVNSQALDMGQAEELAKTLQAGHGYLGAPTSLVGGAALQVESLDSTLKSVTYDASNLIMWPSIPQDRAYSLVEQYVRTNSYGDGGSAFVPESGSPSMNDSEYNRHAQKVVFLSTRRGVSLASTLVRSFAGDAESRESQAGTLWMLERLERELYKGNADFSNNGKFDGEISAIPSKMQNLNLSGLEVQLRSGDSDFSAQARAFDGFGGADSIIKDMEGDIISESTIEDLANVLMQNFGRPDQLHLAPKQMSDFIKQFFPKERVNVLGIADGKAGYVVREMVTTAGSIALRPNLFLKPKDAPKSQNDRASVPQAPAAAAAALATDGDSKLKLGEKYSYSVSAVNEQGECAATAATSEVTVDADGKNIKVTISAPAGGAAPTHYAVYRSDKNGAGKKFVGYVKAAGASTVFTDRGEKVEGGATAYMLDMRPEIMVWKQLAPLMKINLAQVSTSKEFLLWLAGTLIIFAPRKSGIIQNIGKA
jgi:hypothetical protein